MSEVEAGFDVCVFASKSTVPDTSDMQRQLCVISVSSTQADQFYAKRPMHLFVLSWFVLYSVMS